MSKGYSIRIPPDRAGLRRPVCAGILVCGALALAAPAAAQHEGHVMPAGPGWTWTFDAQAFLDVNLQERKFTNFNQVESQNWFMAHAMRPLGRGTLRTQVMGSLEPFTLRKIGSAEVFQVGETFQGALLKDYQHPHDLVMGAGVGIDWPVKSAATLHLDAALVGAPALGPEAYMHRLSSESNPTAPLGHHHLDSTHITHGVLTAGVSRGGWTAEASAFNGREPDEHRIAIEFGPIDSYAARLSWRGGGWHAQVSGGHIKYPDPTEQTDVDRFTASIDRTGSFRGRPVSWLIAWGLNREPGLGVTSPAWLAEGTWRPSAPGLLYARAELVDQDVLTSGGYDPPDFHRPHVLSRIAALTLGYDRALASAVAGRWSLGADATIYRTPANLLESYGHPFSAHIYLRYAFARAKH